MINEVRAQFEVDGSFNKVKRYLMRPNNKVEGDEAARHIEEIDDEKQLKRYCVAKEVRSDEQRRLSSERSKYTEILKRPHNSNSSTSIIHATDAIPLQHQGLFIGRVARTAQRRAALDCQQELR